MARLEDEPSLLGTDAFKRIKLPASLMIESDASERHRAILSEMARSTDADLAQGTGKFERLLAPVGLGGAVPKPIKDAVFHAQQVRNIWAHRAGAADRRFVERCPNLGFRAGERVDIDLSLYRRLTTGIHTYGFLVGNRCRLVRGLPPVPVLGVSSENEDVSVASDVEEDGGAASPLT